jgi:excisionase family DNA binding protein
MSAGPIDRDGADGWLTPTEVAGRLRVDRSTVTRWAVSGKLPCVHVGPYGRRRFRASVISALAEGSAPMPVRLRSSGTSARPPLLRLIVDADTEAEDDPRRDGGDEFSVALGAGLRAARLDRGWSLQDAAAAAGRGIQPTTIDGYERGDRRITASRLATLAAAYGLTPAELLPRSDRAAPHVAVGAITLAVDRLDQLPAHLAGPMSRYAAAVLDARGTPLAHRLTMRSADLFVLAPALDTTPAGLIQQLDRWNVLVEAR